MNAAVMIDTPLSAERTLAALAKLEKAGGRVRDARWGPRTIDLDLISFGTDIRPNIAEQTRWRELPEAAQKTMTPGELILPHPRLQDRTFVLYPMRDIAPDWIHPVTGDGIDAMLAALPDALHREISVLR